MKKLRKILPWDLALALAATLAVYLALPYHISGHFLREVYQTALFLQILLFITALLVTGWFKPQNPAPSLASDRINLTAGYRHNILVTGIALLYSVAIYGFTTYSIRTNPEYLQNKTWFSLSVWFLSYTISGLLRSHLAFFKLTASKNQQ